MIRLREKWLVAGVLAITAIAYLRCLGGDFVFDDVFMIPRNRYLPRWDFLSRSLVRDSWWFYDFNEVGFKRGSYYRPLQDIWMGLNYHLWGLNPHLWHLPMIALHLVAVWLVYKLARLLSGSGPAALIAALLFGLLPIHADAIVWPSAVPLPMSAVFQLGAFYLFAVRAQNAARNWTLALLLYVGALLSHESATIFPGLIAAYALLLEPSTDISRPVVARTPELSRTADSDIWKRSAIETAPFVLLVIAYLGLRWLVLGYVGDLPSRPVSASTSEVIATVPWAWLHFVEITLLPWMAGPSHRVLYVASWTSPKFLLSLVIFAPAAGWLSFGRFAKQRLYLFCAIWFFLPLIPEIALIPTHQEAFVQDRYLYLASFAWCLVIADAVTAFAVATTAERKATFIAVAALAGLYAITLFRVQRFWLNDLSYFGECVAEFPEMPIYHHNLSTALVHASRLPEALDQMNIAVTLAPKSGYLLWERGLLDALMGRYTDAMRDKLEAASMKPRTKASDYVTLAEDADKAGEPTEVKAALQAAEALPDANRQAQMARAQLRIRHGDLTGATRILEDLASAYPDDSQVWYLLANSQFVKQDYSGAATSYLRAIALARNEFPEARYRAALAFHHAGRDAEALEQCKLVLKEYPRDRGTLALAAEIESHRQINK